MNKQELSSGTTWCTSSPEGVDIVAGPELAGAGIVVRGAAGCWVGSGCIAPGIATGAVVVDIAPFFSFTVNWSPRLIPNEEIGNSGTRTSGCGG